MRTFTGSLVMAALAAAGAGAQEVPAWYPWHDEVVPEVTLASVTLDGSTGEFVYAYSIANGAAATQSLESLYLELAVAPTGMAAPAGWDVMVPGDPGIAVFFAGGDIDPAWVPAHDGDLPRFLSNVPPGGSLHGLTLRSPCAGGLPITYYARGYDHYPAPPADDTATWIVLPTWRDDAVSGSVTGPGDCSAVADWGNRRPAVDGFVGLVNFADGAALDAGPVTVQLRFARDGETVDVSTLRVELNRTDVTAAFVLNAAGDAIAVFPPGSSPARSGRNTLLVAVDGIVPGTTRSATDADRFTFTLP